MTGFASVAVMTTPRLVYAIACRGLLPSWLARVHPVRRTPAAAIIAHTTISFLLSSTGTFAALAVLSSVSVVAVYFMACVSALQLQRRGITVSAATANTAPERPALHVPAPVLGAGAAFCVALLAQATRLELLMIAALLAAATVWYLIHLALGRISAGARDGVLTAVAFSSSAEVAVVERDAGHVRPGAVARILLKSLP